ncbi:30ae0cf1-48eb-4e0b-8ef6-96c82c6c237c [Sclerotinia trifoliorum]|uniref:30ae0cf1-48eb-4e0b-8ef6-96c82c6c237c n=1 Tax=Sclerotinia trifoliorum TaxID=28548 RepID=A0A8H2VQY4_9HELO|nr:30ae0cf1-48eb-4e0b-8ef6-96c82c6c237c [Sclerotinia trifoliorum]
MATYTSTPLFGGALIVDLPSTFADVSTIRQVPDHQEVYLDKDGFTSIIFDITERVGTAGSSPATDGAAMTTHLEDIVDSDLDTVKVWSITDTKFTKLPEGIPAYTLIATQTPPHDPNSHTSAPDFTAIVLNLIRLERERTDILVTINVPHIKGEYSADDVDLQLGKQGKLIENAVEHAAKIWETFKIKDWGLFDEV